MQHDCESMALHNTCLVCDPPNPVLQCPKNQSQTRFVMRTESETSALRLLHIELAAVYDSLLDALAYCDS